MGHPFGRRLFLRAEERYRFFHAHIQYVIDIFPLILHFQDIRLETFPAAFFAHHLHIRHKLHGNGDKTVSQALRTPSSIDIEGKMGMAVSVQFGIRLLRKNFPDVVVNLQIGDGIGAGGFPDGILIHEFHGSNAAQVAAQLFEGSRFPGELVEMAAQRRIKNVAH